jgi:hypothetical protein
MDEGESEREKSVIERRKGKSRKTRLMQYGSVVSVQCLCKEALQGKTS